MEEIISSFHAILDKRKNFLMETLKKRVHSHGLFKQKKNKFITKYIELKLNIFF